MFDKLRRWLESGDLFPKKSIDDVLELSTGKNLEAHAHTAADKAETRLGSAEEHEQKMSEELAEAETRYSLVVARRFNIERLSASVVSVLQRLRLGE